MSGETKVQTHPQKETPWIDAWIRWDRDTHGTDDDDGFNDNVENESPPVAATDTFSFHYHGTIDQPDIDIELRGFPSDSEQTWNSTGLTLWRSSEHLCDCLVKQWRKGSTTANLFTENKRFLEVGSGLGRSGILAFHCLSSLMGPSDEEQNKLLCLTDGDTDVLHQLRNNLQHNQPESTDEGPNVALKCTQLLWGRDRAIEFLQRADNKKFDVLFGSDLIYVKKVINPLFETVSTLLEDSGCFIMAHCARRQGNEVTMSMVFDAALSFGFEHKVIEEDQDVSVVVFRRKHN